MSGDYGIQVFNASGQLTYQDSTFGWCLVDEIYVGANASGSRSYPSLSGYTLKASGVRLNATSGHTISVSGLTVSWTGLNVAFVHMDDSSTSPSVIYVYAR